MADLKVSKRTTGQRFSGTDQMHLVEGPGDGSIYTVDWKTRLGLSGRIFHAAVGSFTTPTTFRIGVDADQPEAVIDVPAGKTIIPVRILTFLETGAGTISEVIYATNPALCGSSTATDGSSGILSTRTSRPLTSGCKFYYTYSGNCTLPANTIEFYHNGEPFVDVVANQQRFFTWEIDTGTPQVIDGPGSLVIYIAGTGTAPAGFLRINWAEFNTNEI